MPVVKIAVVTFISDDRVRDVLHDFDADDFDSFYPKVQGRSAEDLDRQVEVGRARLPFSTWSLTSNDVERLVQARCVEVAEGPGAVLVFAPGD